MNIKELLTQYRNDLGTYSLKELRHKNEHDVWSIGQMFDHIIVVSNEYLDNAEACLGQMAIEPSGKSSFGEQLFREGGFPEIKIRLPDEMNAPPNNSDSQAELTARLDRLIERTEHLKSIVGSAHPHHKVLHGGFGWLNAQEWFDLVGMHARHHLRQKTELEHFIN